MSQITLLSSGDLNRLLSSNKGIIKWWYFFIIEEWRAGLSHIHMVLKAYDLFGNYSWKQFSDFENSFLTQKHVWQTFNKKQFFENLFWNRLFSGINFRCFQFFFFFFCIMFWAIIENMENTLETFILYLRTVFRNYFWNCYLRNFFENVPKSP